MGRVLSQSVFVGGVVYPAGTAETDELSKLIRNPDHWDGDEADSPEGYQALDKGALEAEVEKRNADRDDDAKIEVAGSGANGNVVKADLIAALEADDEA